MKKERLIKEINSGIERIMAEGADFCDARYYTEDSSETLTLYDGNLESNETTFESGLGVRVLYKGAWGFAASSREVAPAVTFKNAFSNAKTASRLVTVPLKMDLNPPVRGKYFSPVDEDPLNVPLEAKLAFLEDLDKKLQGTHIEHRIIEINLQRMHNFYWNSEGSFIERKLINCFAGSTVMALDSDGKMQMRSKVLHTPGHGTRGWEMVTKPELWSGRAEGIKEELARLLEAPELDFGKRSVILLPGQGMLQVHETIGHPLELDRILGYELSYAGGSFVRLESIGQLRYGSEKLNVSAYGSIANSPGSFGFDDEGTPERDYLLIDKGILVNCLTSRAMISEANQVAGRQAFDQSGGASRSTAFYRAPIDRMTNVSILPGNDGNLDRIISATEDGLVLDNPKSWSIGSNREHFHFSCEIAWEVKDGRITRVLKNPTYQGHTLEFYANLNAVGDSSTWVVEQVPNCGKGEPNQLMEIGHGVPVLRFENVITGERV
ncbi:MAG: TldD/PmbA family protein [Bacillota bacterium]|nr:TldD/PmbA family protein [Bacillota bacterium]